MRIFRNSRHLQKRGGFSYGTSVDLYVKTVQADSFTKRRVHVNHLLLIVGLGRQDSPAE